MPAPENTPDDIDALRTALAAEQAARREAEARASGAEALVLQLKLLIAKLKHDKFGASSERGRKLIDQLELQLDELVTAASEAATAVEKPAPKDATAERPPPPARKPVRAPLPAHLPRERVVVPAPSACLCCSGRLSKLGEDITETLEVIPRQWKVVQTVRERFCLTNNAAERALRGIALGRKAWLFAGSDRGGERAAAMYSLIVTAKMNDVDPRAWLADVLARIADQPASRLDELLPWNWKRAADRLAA